MSHLHRSADVIAPRSPFYQGPFGRLFPELDGWRPPGVPDHELDEHFLRIANDRMSERPTVNPGELSNPADVEALETEIGSAIPAGYTYFGQFVDHDVTFDPTSSLQRSTDPSGLLNFRTPRLDLDCLYGRGPADQPYLYTDGGRRFLIGTATGCGLPDLPRNSEGRALIGDMRNDENVMVSQLQLAFLLAHNELVTRAEQAGAGDPFEAARRTLRWLYQWLVWNDFLSRLTDVSIWASALRLTTGSDGPVRWDRGLRAVYDWKHQPFMPVEFSAAAYRFGHSMVRNSYRPNDPHAPCPGGFTPIFDNTGTDDPEDLRGFRAVSARNVLQWDRFLPMGSEQDGAPQLARLLDTRLANALATLHEGPAGDPLNVLAFRNLRRGVALGLPAGTAVARRLGLVPLDLDDGEPDSLWFYVLREAEAVGGGRLGSVGSTIVAATFAGLLGGDRSSFFRAEPNWHPSTDELLRDGDANVDDPTWTLASIIRLSGLPVNGDDFG